MKFREYKVMCFSKCWKKKAWLEKAGFLCNRTRREKEYMCRQHAHASCRTDLRISQLCQQDNRTQAMLTKVHLFPDCGVAKGRAGERHSEVSLLYVLIGAFTFPLTFSPVGAQGRLWNQSRKWPDVVMKF